MARELRAAARSPGWKYGETGAHTPRYYEALEPKPAFPVSGSGATAP